MKKKEKEHWALEALNQGCFEAGKVISKARRWLSGLDWQDAKKTTEGTLDILSEKAENVVESVKKSILDIGGSFKSGFAASEETPVKTEVLKGKKSARKSKAPKERAGTAKVNTKEGLPAKAEENPRDDKDEPSSASSRKENLDKTAEDEDKRSQRFARAKTSEGGSFSGESEDLEKEIDNVTEYLPDIGDVKKNAL